ncbi:osmoprotectant transport system substrate-binding protein [Herbihabitans rhizosphaerae]|uniref:Osmoprotectant transport system substrate-binding protein n=1 Tax=Herbihabitans rhizosphaerae TaxID=1872711 RepID=A0A4Q7KHM7_9PSEU|nr:ABC transporter substrate-binding protein [Herbihabitans rhizosphaerae]RZS32757.1 osmoprotectant transport system substrate-binding protein [Herbihabitans rhizosphaerae]
MKRTVVSLIAAAAVVGMSACGSSDPLSGGSSGIVVGSADFAESELLAEIYAEALRKTGATVSTKLRVGAREVYVEAVRKGEISLVPDYTGNLLKYVVKPAEPAETTTEAVYGALKTATEKPDSTLQVLEQSKAEDSDVLAVTKATADSGVKSMADLGPKCGQFVLGAAEEWKGRWEAKIKELYGCTFKQIKPIEGGTLTVKSLKDNEVQVANLFTTASAIKENSFVPLEDPKKMYPAQNIVPLINKSKLDDKQKAAVNKVSAALTTDKLTELVRKVEVDKANAADVAKSYVGELGIS